MPLRFAVNDDGHTGEDLRIHRGVHLLHGTGQCRRLAKLLPSKVSDNGAAAEIAYELAEWLSAPTLVGHSDVHDKKPFMFHLGRERMGAALDRALARIEGDAPRTPSVLRAELRSAAAADRQANGEVPAYVLHHADLYQVAAAFPTGAAVDDVYDWVGHLTFGGLQAADGTQAVYGALTKSMGVRFLPGTALAATGPIARFAKAIHSAVDEDDAEEYAALDAAGLAAEVSSWLVRVLPLPDELTELEDTPTRALVTLKRALKAARSGSVVVVDVDSVVRVIQHHEVPRLVIGADVSGSVALNLLMELVRLSLNVQVASVTLAQLGSAMLLLADLLPALRSDRISSLPPTERLAYVAQETDAWRRTERTAARGGSGGSSGSSAAAGADDASGAVGYPSVYQAPLRRLLGSDGFQDAVAAVGAHMDSGDYGEAITVIYGSGYLPLIHAMGGQRRSLPGCPLVDRIAEELRPLGPQFVGDTIAGALLPPNTSGLVRKRAPAMVTAFNQLCKGAFDQVPWEDMMFEVLAACNNRPPPRKLPEALRFTSMVRLKEVEEGIITLLEKFGKARGTPRSFDKFLLKVYQYDNSARAVAQAIKTSTISGAIKTVLQEQSVATAAVLNSNDPTRQPSVHMVQPGSGGEAALDDATAELPQKSAMVNALLGAVSEEAAARLGITTQLDITDFDQGRSSAPAPTPAPTPALTSTSAQPAPQAPPPAPPPAPPEASHAGDDAPKSKKEPEVGAWHARLCEETETHYKIGNKKARSEIPKVKVKEVCGDLLEKPDEFCLWSALSTSKWPSACCGDAGKKGHEKPTSRAHTFDTKAKKTARQKLLGLLVAAAATGGDSLPVGSAGPGRSWGADGGQLAGGAGGAGVSVPTISAEMFESHPGVLFVPMRRTAAGGTELGLPKTRDLRWWGELGLPEGRGVREAALATAWNWSDTLFGNSSDIVPFGLFEDVGGARGQVTGVVLPRAADLARVTVPRSPEPLTVVDLFAGAGGLSLGLSEAGYEHAGLLERDQRTVATLRRNGYANVTCGDVADADLSHLRGNVTLVAGGPPCQPFSVGGLGRGADDERNGWEAALDAVDQVRPRAVLFENVRGLMAPRFEQYRGIIARRLTSLGYTHSWHSLDAADYGLAQHRRRTFLVGFQSAKAAGAFELPKKVERWLTVREALRPLGPPASEGDHAVHGRAREYAGHTASVLDKPSKTIVGGGRGLGGGSGTVRLDNGTVRYYTVREAATLQGFPRSWQFDPVWSRAFIEIGNAVPPPLARLLGEAVARALAAADPPSAAAVAEPGGAKPGASSPAVRWVEAPQLMSTPLARVARLVVARLDSFTVPAPLLRHPDARVGALEPTAVLAAAGAAAPTAGSKPMAAEEVWRESLAAVTDLKSALADKIAELLAQGTQRAKWLAGELQGWLDVAEPPPLGEVDPSVMALAVRPTDPQLDNVSFPAYARPVSTPPLPPLPRDPAPPAAIPGFATRWVHAFSAEAHEATLSWFKQLRRFFLGVLEGPIDGALYRLMPRDMAFGIEHFQPWLAQLAAAGHVVARQGGKFVLVDQSKPPETQLNRSYIEELFKESGCTDLSLRDAALTHGFVYLTDLPPQVVLQKPLRSICTDVEGFLSLHEEVLRMSANNWFVLTVMDDLDAGHFELHSCPGRFDPTGGQDRAYETRKRPIKDAGAPHKLLLCMAPPSPALHNISGGGRVPVRSTNASTGAAESKMEELKPFFTDIMLAVCILGRAAALAEVPLFVAGDDIKDMFHTFPLAVLQCWAMGLLRLDPTDLSQECLDAALCVVQARVLEMGVAPSSNWAQRFITECNLGFSKRFARANEPLLAELERSHAEFAAWRAARRALAVTTGRAEDVGHYLTGYTDDVIALVISVPSMVLFLMMHAEHYGPRGLNMRMAIAAKRSLGVSATFIGGSVVTVGALAYVRPEKLLRTANALEDALNGIMLLAAWAKLVGLLNHLVCVLLMPYYVMYDIYDISDACRRARLTPEEPIIVTAKGRKALLKWRDQLSKVAGTSALAAAFALRRAGCSGIVHALRSDAAVLGTAFPALCGNLYRHVYILRLTRAWLQMPIVALEFLGGLLNIVVFGHRLRGAPCALLLDALVVPTVMAGKACSPMMRYLQQRFIELVQETGLQVDVAQEYGTYNVVTDAGSRGKIEELEAIMSNMGMPTLYEEVPEAGLTLMDDALAEWQRLSEAEREAALAEPAEAAARRRHGRRGDQGPGPVPPALRERPLTEEERQTGRPRLNSDAGPGRSPYMASSRRAAAAAHAKINANLWQLAQGERADERASEAASWARQRGAREGAGSDGSDAAVHPPGAGGNSTGLAAATAESGGSAAAAGEGEAAAAAAPAAGGGGEAAVACLTAATAESGGDEVVADDLEAAAGQAPGAGGGGDAAETCHAAATVEPGGSAAVAGGGEGGDLAEASGGDTTASADVEAELTAGGGPGEAALEARTDPPESAGGDDDAAGDSTEIEGHVFYEYSAARPWEAA